MSQVNRVNDVIPRPVVTALIAQLALLVVDTTSLFLVGFAILGMTQSTSSAGDATVSLVMGALVIGYAVVTVLGFALGIGASFALYRGRTWGRTASMAHAILALLSCSPCNWLAAAFAIVTANHPDVRAWPSMPARDLIETFR